MGAIAAMITFPFLCRFQRRHLVLEAFWCACTLNGGFFVGRAFALLGMHPAVADQVSVVLGGV